MLIVLSEWGYWGEELVGPLGEFDRVGYEVEFCTPTGRRPNAIPVSMDPDFVDPPLQRSVTSPEMAARVREIDDPSTQQGKRLDNPINLAAWFPDRPYFASSQFVRLLEDYNWELEEAVRRIDRYDALLIVGGSGPIVDLANNQRAARPDPRLPRAGKPIGAECYGVACLAFARDLDAAPEHHLGQARHRPLPGVRLQGRHRVRGGSGKFLDFNMGPPPYPLEYILRDATGPDGGYHGNFGHPTSVIVDYPFVTGTVDAGLRPDRPEDGRGARRRSAAAPVGLVAGRHFARSSGSTRHRMSGNAMATTTGHRKLLEQLRADGITTMFGNPGTSEQGLLDEVSRFPADPVHAGSAGNGAGVDGQRLRPGDAETDAVQLHCGVGLGNGIGMIYQAIASSARRSSSSPASRA